MGKSYANFVEVNLESKAEVLENIFSKDFDSHRILRELALFFGKQIIPGKTLLFLDVTVCALKEEKFYKIIA